MFLYRAQLALTTRNFYQEIKDEPRGLQDLWEKELEAKSLFGNRIFCFTFAVCYPSTSLLYFLNGNPNYQSIFLIQITCSSLVARIIFLHSERK